MKRSLGVSLVSVILFGGCASAGGTAGVLDTGSVWYKHPATGDVKECGGGFYPGVQIRRYNCGKRRTEEGYTEVEKCKVAQPGALCVTDAEIDRAERREKYGATSADRLQELKELHDKKLITDEEYEAKRKQILDGM